MRWFVCLLFALGIFHVGSEVAELLGISLDEYHRILQDATGARVFSFEFFPPRTEQGAANLRQVRDELATLKPRFFSVTFGAGGSEPSTPSGPATYTLISCFSAVNASNYKPVPPILPLRTACICSVNSGYC
jgi:hypothetical protein